MWEEVSPDKRDGDVCKNELPLEGSATEGEPKRLVSVGEDARAVGSYQMYVGAQTTTTVNHGLREEGSAGICVMVVPSLFFLLWVFFFFFFSTLSPARPPLKKKGVQFFFSLLLSK